MTACDLPKPSTGCLQPGFAACDACISATGQRETNVNGDFRIPACIATNRIYYILA